MGIRGPFGSGSSASRDKPGRAGSGKGPLRSEGAGSGKHGRSHAVTCGMCCKRVVFDTRRGRAVELMEDGRDHDCPGNQIRAMENLRRLK